MTTSIVLASHNAGKIKEFTHRLGSLGLKLIPQSDLGIASVSETGKTFVENAILKARAAASEKYSAIADDSGLVVNALQGAPGIYSARYAGQDASDAQNNQKLLSALDGLPDDQRQAYFVCVIVFMRHANDPLPAIFEATWHGRILHKPVGHDGFGYDPLFYIPKENCTAAELDLSRKNTISHRGQAMQKLCTYFSQQTVST